MKREQKDSMGLMIDTMCNGVGGLVLVAILIVLVTLGESPSSAEGQMQRKQLENEVEALEIKHELLRLDNQRMSENRDSFGDKFVKAISGDEIKEQTSQIQKQKRRIQNLNKRMEELQVEQANAERVDPGIYLAAELEEFSRLRAESDELKAQLNKAEKVLVSKKSKSRELLNRVTEMKERKSQTLRTAVERKYDRYDFIFFRYDKCYIIKSESLFSPSREFNILEQSTDNIKFEPKRGAGLELESKQLRDFLIFVKREGGTCLLEFYPDSFELYLPVRNLLDEFGLSLGIDFHTDDNPPAFTKTGGIPIMGQGQ
jgi:hypothetical protein